MKKLAALMLIPPLTFSLAACSSEKSASKEEVMTGLEKMVEPTLAAQTVQEGDELNTEVFHSEVIQPYVKCAVDKSYDSLSPATRNDLAKSTEQNLDTLHIDKKDADLLKKNLDVCLDTFNTNREQVLNEGRLFVEQPSD